VGLNGVQNVFHLVVLQMFHKTHSMLGNMRHSYLYDRYASIQSSQTGKPILELYHGTSSTWSHLLCTYPSPTKHTMHAMKGNDSPLNAMLIYQF
jgi:hypothetical protein